MRPHKLEDCANSTSEKLQSELEAGNEFIVSEQVADLDRLVDEHLRLGRHDRALELACRMYALAQGSKDAGLAATALRAIGRTHLRFGHLDALVRVWERLADRTRLVSTR